MTFLKRACTTVVGLPAVVLVVYFGGLPLLLTCALAALIGLYELYRAFSLPVKLVVSGMFFSVLNFTALYFFTAVFWHSLVLFVLYLAMFSVVFYGKVSLHSVLTCLFGFILVPFMLSFVVLVRELPFGHLYVWLVFVACFGCDTFSYIFGSAFGNRKLKGTPSPSKTVEGLVGGVLSATFLGFLFTLVFGKLELAQEYGITLGVALAASAITFVGAVLSVFGDMFGSLIKRNTDIKDFGNFFPGHGGVMDRLDSIIVVAPTMFLVLTFLEAVFS